MTRDLRRWIARLAPLIVLVCLLALRTFDPAPVRQIRVNGFDQLQRIAPRKIDVAQSRVRIVDIDDLSLARMGQWPWPRDRVAALIKRLTDLGAIVIGFDMVFAEPDRTSPRQAIQRWPVGPKTPLLQDIARTLPDYDQLFARTLAQSRVVGGFILTGGKLVRAPALKSAFAWGGEDPRPYVPTFSGAVVNLPGIGKSVTGNGAVNWLPDGDNIMRRLPTVLRLNDQLYPSLFAETLRVAQGTSGLKIRTATASGEGAFGAGQGITAVQIGGVSVPTDSRGRMLIHYARSDPRRYISAWRVMQPDFDPAKVKNRIILIGTSAAGLKDIRATPVSIAMPGVEIHAQAIEQVIAGQFLVRPDYATAVELLYLLLLGLFVVLLVPRVGAAWASLVGIAGIGTALGVAYYAFAAQGYLLDGLFPAMALIIVFLITTLVEYLRTEGEREAVRSAFAHYLSPALVEKLARQPNLLRLGGETRDMSILFSDIRDFTTMSERFDAAGLTRFMNAYLTPMTDAVLSHQGTVDKYMGDAVMAFWNAPIDVADHARAACLCALDMRQRLEQLNRQMEEGFEEPATDPSVRRHQPIRIGIGINSGACSVGNMGSDQRFDYSVLGDEVNLASRIEGLSKTYGVDIVLGVETQKRVPDLATMELDLVQVKGKTVPVQIFVLVGDDVLAQSAVFQTWRQAHDRMIDAYRRQDWDPAVAALQEARQLAVQAGHTQEPLYRLFEERIEHYRHHAPPKGWDGVFVAKTK